jgi:DNA-binding GntR family transcriptional regulator
LRDRGTIPHGGRAAHTYASLRDLIVRGDLPAGARITEHECAVRLGVSRTPVREALDRLRRERFVVANSGGLRAEAAVAPLDPAAVADFWTLIGTIEGLAIGAVGDMSRHESHALAATLTTINEGLIRAATVRPIDIAAVVPALAEFHEALIRGCGRPHLIPIHDLLVAHIQRFDWAQGSVRSDYRATTREHRAIIEVIRRRDAARGKRLLEAHWRAGLARTVRQQRLGNSQRMSTS